MKSKKAAVPNIAPKTPTELRKILFTAPRAQELWDDLTPVARRDFLSWIESAKQPETRKRRLESIPSRLLSGKRRPCCYALVPMNLYKALAGTPKAKAMWRSLTPDEKRDFSQWVDAGKSPEERRTRVETACLKLAAGKRHS